MYKQNVTEFYFKEFDLYKKKTTDNAFSPSNIVYYSPFEKNFSLPVTTP